MAEVKKSKFEKKAIELLESEENLDVQAERSYRKNVSKIRTQLSQLEGKKVDLESEIDDAKDNVDRAKFSLEFDLYEYDNACSTLEKLEDELKAVNKTMENREKLLKDWE